MQQTVILLIARQSYHIHVPMIARLIGKRSENYTRKLMARMTTDRLLGRTGSTIITGGRSAACHYITDHGLAQLARTLEVLDALERNVLAMQRTLVPPRERTAMAPVLVRANYGNDTVVANKPS